MTDRLGALKDTTIEFRGRALWVVLGCLICQMGLGLPYIRTGLAAELIDGLGLTRAELSSAAFPQLVLQSLMSPVVGILCVRLGASRILATSAALFAFVFFYFSRIDSLSELYITMAGIGFCAAGMGDITIGHVVSQWFRKNRGLALGIAYAGSNLGGMVMVMLVGTVTASSGWRHGMLAVIPVALFVLVPAALFLIRDAPYEYLTGNADSAGDDRTNETPLAADLDLKSAMKTRSFWILTLTLFAFFFYFTGILDHFVLFLIDEGMSKEDARFYFSRAIGLGIVSKVIGGAVSDRIPRQRAIQAVYALLAFSSLVLLALPNPALLWVFVLSYGFSQACRDVVYPLMLGRCFGDRYLGEIYGAMTLTLLPGGTLGPIFAALLREEFGDYKIAFSVFAVLNVLAFAGLFLVRDERRSIAPISS